MLWITTSHFGEHFSKCLQLASLRDGMWAEGGLWGCSAGFLFPLKIFQVSLSPCSTPVLFLPSFLLAPLLLTRHWGCAAAPTIHEKHRMPGYKYLAKGVQVGSQAETQEEMCCFGLYWILGLITKPAPSWLLPHGQAAPASQREWEFYLWSYKSSLHLLLCQSLLPLPATRAYSAAYLLKRSPGFIFLWGWPKLLVQEPTLQEVCDAHPPQWWWNRAQQSSAGCRWNIPWLMVRQKGDKQQHLGNIPLPTYHHHLLSFSKTQISWFNLHFHSWEWLLN